MIQVQPSTFRHSNILCLWKNATINIMIMMNDFQKNKKKHITLFWKTLCSRMRREQQPQEYHQRYGLLYAWCWWMCAMPKLCWEEHHGKINTTFDFLARWPFALGSSVWHVQYSIFIPFFLKETQISKIYTTSSSLCFLLHHHLLLDKSLIVIIRSI